MILFVNACVRAQSRTKRLADCLIAALNKPVKELRLEKCAFPLTDEEFINKRDRLIAEGSYDDPVFDLARGFSQADEIVIAAPFWDFSFPASLKQYFEQINAVGVTFRYNEKGAPEGLCKARRLFYVTTAGGDFVPEYGFGYVKELANSFYGINDVELIKAEGLDIYGADVERILLDCEGDIVRRFGQ